MSWGGPGQAGGGLARAPGEAAGSTHGELWAEGGMMVSHRRVARISDPAPGFPLSRMLGSCCEGPGVSPERASSTLSWAPGEQEAGLVVGGPTGAKETLPRRLSAPRSLQLGSGLPGRWPRRCREGHGLLQGPVLRVMAVVPSGLPTAHLELREPPGLVSALCAGPVGWRPLQPSGSWCPVPPGCADCRVPHRLIELRGCHPFVAPQPEPPPLGAVYHRGRSRHVRRGGCRGSVRTGWGVCPREPL